ncbi:hypothetical protein FVF58_39105 [Paraburkholderia panacisoli]|jgi:hypothetical protein|uniref:Uncharacterized protein n=1 Tax=Paraburkholderia panacisoli TaxID=2603818 RepID=A0A5B0GI04_9BURK|nr:hypothetical protein [Paraburkholderia panacisoli]KAA1001670.1 hypothetical protein FVF58_39105 [Paraburkholderia panacisoli]
MLPFLSLHALAAQRGDGLRPELLALFERHARAEAGLSAIIEPVETGSPYQVVDVVPEHAATKPEADESSASVSCWLDPVGR